MRTISAVCVLRANQTYAIWHLVLRSGADNPLRNLFLERAAGVILGMMSIVILRIHVAPPIIYVCLIFSHPNLRIVRNLHEALREFKASRNNNRKWPPTLECMGSSSRGFREHGCAHHADATSVVANPQIRWPSVGRVSKQCAKWVAHWMHFHVKRSTFVHALVHCGYVVLYSIMVRTQS